MNILIIQARCGSSRLPNKIFLELNKKPLLQILIDRLSLSKNIDKIVIATSTNTEDDKVESYCINNNIECYRGNERDLITR